MAFLIVKIFLVTIGIFNCCAQNDKPIKFFRKDYVLSSDSSLFYKEHTVKQKWDNAVATCKEEGAELFVPSTFSEMDLIRINSNYIWLAYQDIYSPDHFTTVDGKLEDEIYVNWAENEPSSGIEGGHCAKMNTEDRTYFVENCNKILPFVCKLNASLVTQNELCQTFDINYKYTSITDRCYKFHKTATTWKNAHRICRNEGSTLAVLNSDQEANLLVLMFKQYPVESLKGNFNKHIIHLGFSDLLSFGNFKTINDKYLDEAGYDKWSNGYENWGQQPDNENDNEHCGSMFRDGTLNDVNCDVKALFVCEKTLPNPDQKPNLIQTSTGESVYFT